MLETIVVACKLGPKIEPSRKMSQFENGQVTYHIPVIPQVGRRVDQIYGDASQVTIPISRPQMMYTTLIMTMQTNIYVGWPPLIPLNYE
jgi:hypothetical protein